MENNLTILRIPDSSLNSVNTGLSLAASALAALRMGNVVVFDFSVVKRMTPSCANALVMTVLDGIGRECFTKMVKLTGTDAVVSEAWNLAADRYERGIRLSTQRNKSA